MGLNRTLMGPPGSGTKIRVGHARARWRTRILAKASSMSQLAEGNFSVDKMTRCAGNLPPGPARTHGPTRDVTSSR